MNPSHSHCGISAPNPSDALTQINPLGPNYAPWAHLDRQMADDAITSAERSSPPRKCVAVMLV